MKRYLPRHDRHSVQKAAGGVRKVSDWALIRRVYGETVGYRSHILGYAALTLLSTPLALLTPVPLKIVVDNVVGSVPTPGWISALMPSALESSDNAVLVFACLLLVAVALLSQMQTTGQGLLATYTGERLTLRFRSRLLAQAQRLSFAFHDRRGTADSVYRIQWDAPALQYIAIYGLIPLTSAGVTLIAMVYVVSRISVQLAVVALAISPFLFAFAHTYKVRMRPRYSEVKKLESRALGVVQEVLTSIRVVAAFGREADERERFTAQSGKGLRARVQLTAFEGAYGLLVAGTTAFGTAAVLYIGVGEVKAGAISLGDLILVIGYLSQLYGPLRSVSQALAVIQNQLASAERAFGLLDEVPDVQERRDARSIERAEGQVEFSHVTFGYEPGKPVLTDTCLKVPSGSRVGIVGRTGSGKSTLVGLLSRFYDPQEGVILLDGRDVREYRLSDLRNQFSIVLQEPVLFSTTISQNIAYARPGASESEIKRAARAADALDFIEGLPDGLETVVGERGMSLSGGERQRISLARAFLKDAPILVLDEPTSSVDSATEESIIHAVEQLMHGRTTFIIAHRTGTLRNCDVVVEIRDGRATIRSAAAMVAVDRTGEVYLPAID